MRLFFIFIQNTLFVPPVRHIKLLLCLFFNLPVDHRLLPLPLFEGSCEDYSVARFLCHAY